MFISIYRGKDKTSKAPEKHRLRLFGFVCLFLLTTPALRAQQNTDYAVHANIIYHFTKYINWPDYKKTGDFVIGIVGSTPLYDELSQFIDNKKVGNQNIIIKKMSSSADSYNCHILFIGEERNSSLKRIAEITAKHPVLIVSESAGMASRGSCINFTIVNERLKLEINKTNIEQRNLDVATELLNLGRVVR